MGQLAPQGMICLSLWARQWLSRNCGHFAVDEEFPSVGNGETNPGPACALTEAAGQYRAGLAVGGSGEDSSLPGLQRTAQGPRPHPHPADSQGR